MPFVHRSTSMYVSNQLLPFVCVFIIAKTPAILLVGFVLGYMMIQPIQLPDETIKCINPPTTVNILLNDHDSDAEEDLVIHLLMENKTRKDSLLDEQQTMSNSSIDFENLMKFPSCPTTLPSLDTHFNFVMDHDIKSPDPSDINWSAIHQEMEYEQQRQDVVDQCSSSSLLLLQQQQENSLPAMVYSSEDTTLLDKEKPTRYGIAAHIPAADAAAVLFVEEEEDELKQDVISINIEDLLLLPTPTPTNIQMKPSLSSPGQLFKSKFQRAVNKMKKSSFHHDQGDKRASSMTTKRAASLQLNSYFNQDDPLFTPLSPRPSASARVHDHFKGRLSKLFRK